jgi:Ca-activated chloride channel homolog
MKKYLLVLLTAITACSAAAQSGRKLVYEGNGLYKKGDYSGAEKKYQQALKKNGNSREARFNLGNVQFRQGQYDEAVKTFETAAGETKEQQAMNLYNKGVALAKQDKLNDAVAAFREALKKNPADEDCRYNLALLMKKLKKQEEEKQKEPKKKNDPKQKDNKKDPEPQKPKPQPSRLNKQQVQQVLQMIRRKEKTVQQKVNQQQTPGIVQKDKDW